MRTVVLLAVGILGAVAGPFKDSDAAKSKWFGANVSAVKIQRAILDYVAKTDSAAGQALIGRTLGNEATRRTLKLGAADLEGIYFTASDYTIISVDSRGFATIKVTSSNIGAPHTSYLLQPDGSWTKL